MRNEPTHTDDVLNARRTVDRESVVLASISCRSNNRQSFLNRTACFVGHATVSTTIVVVLLTMRNADRDVQQVDTMSACIGDCLDEIPTSCSAVFRDYAIEIDLSLGREIAENLEDVTAMAGCIRNLSVDIVFSTGNGVCVPKIGIRLIE
jgi:hypothetical protein